MGAEYFEDYVEGDQTLRDAFDKAVKQAEWDYGHSGYSGTIKETGGATNLDFGTYRTHTEARIKADELIDDERIQDKWGPCGALRVKDETHDGWFFFGWASC